MKYLAVLAVSASLAFAQPRDIKTVLQPFLDNHTLAGAVVAVATPDKVLGVETAGYADLAARKPMRADAMFWIASMSKPITATAFMMLVDEGKVKLDDPAEKYLPEFKDQWLTVESDKDHRLLKPAPRPITVRDILSHTSGLPFSTPLEQPTLDVFPLEARVRSYAMSPLVFAPGTKYQYSNAGINTAGRIIEVVTGMSYERFLDARLFKPLGMKDTTFWPAGEQLARIAKSYKNNKETGQLEEISVTQLRYPLDDRTRQPMPAGGLFSTTHDVVRFLQMLASGGVFEGRRYLSASAITEMTRVQTGSLKVNDQVGYGLGWSVRDADGDNGLAAGSYGHSGAYKTLMWVDARSKRIFVLMRQHSGDVPHGDHLPSELIRAAMGK